MASQPEQSSSAAPHSNVKKLFPIHKYGVRGGKAVPKYFLELMKFSCYVSIPILLLIGFGADSEWLAKVIRNREYIVYPPEGPRPPPPEVYFAIAKKRKEIREAAEREAAAAAAGDRE